MEMSFSEFKFFQSFKLTIEQADNLRFSAEMEDSDQNSNFLEDAILTELSARGITITTKTRISINQSIRISLNFKKLNLDLTGKVIRAFSASIQDERIIYGIEIEEEEEIKRLIEQYILSLPNEKMRDILLETALKEQFDNPFERFEVFSLLLSLFKDITKFGEKPDFIETMLEEVTRVLNATRSCILLIDPETSELKAMAASGMDKSDLRFDYRMGIAGSVFTSGISLNIDIQKDPSRFDLNLDEKSGLKTRSIMCHPIHNRDDKIIGVVEVANKRNQDRFSVEDEKIMKVVTLVFSGLYHNYNPISDESMIRRFSNPTDRKDALIGKSKIMQGQRNSILRVKDLEGPLLILGETGVGKNLYAGIVHKEGKRGIFPMVSIQAPLLMEKDGENLLAESIQKANKGTLIIQDIERLNLTMQKKVFSSVYKNNAIRLIATSIEQLPRLVAEALFDKDFYDYLSLSTIVMSPLRKRKEDLPDLINYFTKMECKEQGLLQKSYSPAAMDALNNYEWPGNIKELKRAIKRVVLYHPKSHIISNVKNLSTPIFDINGFKTNLGDIDDIPFVNDSHIVLKDRLALVERQIIVGEIKRFNGNKSKAAKEMGISREALRKKLMISQDIIDALEYHKKNNQSKKAQ